MRDPDATTAQGGYIAIAGNIGAGKSSLTSWLTANFDLSPVFEPNDENPFLEDFYEDMPRWAFASQMWFLARKIALHQDLRQRPRHVVQDRTIWEDAEIFAEHLGRSGKMSRREHATYRDLYQAVVTDLPAPDLLIYLRCPPRVLQQRIRQRGRAMEQEIPAPYLRALHRLYERWYERWDRSPKIIFESDRFDPVTNLLDRKDVLALISKTLHAP